MRKLGTTISFRNFKEETKHPEPVSPSSYNYDIQQDSAETIPHAYFLSRHAKLRTNSSHGHTLCQEKILNGTREDFFGSSLKSGCQRKTKKTFPEYFKRERFKMLKNMKMSKKLKKKR